MSSGYTDCACRDCFDVAVSSDTSKPELCSDCEDAGCDGGECQRPDAYGCGEPKPETKILGSYTAAMNYVFDNTERGETIELPTGAGLDSFLLDGHCHRSIKTCKPVQIGTGEVIFFEAGQYRVW